MYYYSYGDNNALYFQMNVPDNYSLCHLESYVENFRTMKYKSLVFHFVDDTVIITKHFLMISHLSDV